MNEDYSEMVVELLCKRIDELENEIKQLKRPQYPGNLVYYVDSKGIWTTPSPVSETIWSVCGVCMCRPCQCNKETATVT